MCENTLITRHCLLQRKSLSGCEFDNKLLFLVRKKQFSTCLIFVAEIPVKIYRQRLEQCLRIINPVYENKMLKWPTFPCSEWVLSLCLFVNLFLYSYDFYSKTMELIFASQNTARCFKQSLLLKILVLVDFEYFMGPNSDLKACNNKRNNLQKTSSLVKLYKRFLLRLLWPWQSTLLFYSQRSNPCWNLQNKLSMFICSALFRKA